MSQYKLHIHLNPALFVHFRLATNESRAMLPILWSAALHERSNVQSVFSVSFSSADSAIAESLILMNILSSARPKGERSHPQSLAGWSVAESGDRTQRVISVYFVCDTNEFRI